MALSKPLQLTNEDGLSLTIRLLRKNDAYGDDDALVYDKDEPSVEIFDASGFEELPEIYGYFTGIRLTVGNLFVENIDCSNMNEHFAVWGISEHIIALIQHWLVQQLSGDEKNFIDINYLERTRLAPEIAEPQAYNPNCAANQFTDTATTDFATFENLFGQQHSHNFIIKELNNALQALDLAESADVEWQQGRVRLRLYILAAKKQILKAIQNINQYS
jgi:hypothetical protein